MTNYTESFKELNKIDLLDKNEILNNINLVNENDIMNLKNFLLKKNLKKYKFSKCKLFCCIYNHIIFLTYHSNHPTNEQMGNHQIILSNKIDIKKEYYLEEYIKNYYPSMPSNDNKLIYHNDEFFKFDKVSDV